MKRKKLVSDAWLVWLSLSCSFFVASSLHHDYENDPTTFHDGSGIGTSGVSCEIWMRTWNGNASDTFAKSWSNETSVYVCGATPAPSNKLYGLLVKFNSTGAQCWNRTWGTGLDRSYFTNVWCDGQFVYTTGCALNDMDLLLVKWASNGTMLWNRTYGYEYPTNNERGTGIWGNDTAIFTLGFWINGSGTTDADLLLVRWDVNGNPVWNRTWDGGGVLCLDVPGSICGYGDSVYISGLSNQFYLLMKWWGNGTMAWIKTWGPASDYWYRPPIWCNSSSVLYFNNSMAFGNILEFSTDGTTDRVVQAFPEFVDVDGMAVVGSDVYLRGRSYPEVISCIAKYSIGGTRYWSRTGSLVGLYLSAGANHLYTGFTNSNLTLVRWDPLGYHPNATFSITPPISIAGRAVRFTCTGHAGDPPTKYQWDFGDSSANDTAGSPVHAFASPGNCTIKVTIEDVEGEVAYHESNVTVVAPGGDLDGDGMPNAWEADHGLNFTFSGDAHLDPDGDGLRNEDEFLQHTDPQVGDTDGDGFSDGDEVWNGTDPVNPWSNVATTISIVVMASATGVIIIGTIVLFRRKRRNRAVS